LTVSDLESIKLPMVPCFAPLQPPNYSVQQHMAVFSCFLWSTLVRGMESARRKKDENGLVLVNSLKTWFASVF